MCKGNAVKGHAGTFYGDKNMFHLVSRSYSVYNGQNSLNWTLKMCAFQ